MPSRNSKIWTIIMERVQFTENYKKKKTPYFGNHLPNISLHYFSLRFDF